MAATPKAVNAIEQIPVYSSLRTDRTQSVLAIVDGLEKGIYTNAALLADGMMRDDRIAAVMHTRATALSSLPFSSEPADDSEQAKLATEALDEIWDECFPDHVLTDLIRWGQLIGIGLARVTWERHDKFAWVPRLEVWHPKHLRWDWNEREFYVYHTQGQSLVKPGGGWLAYTPHGYFYGWRRGLMLPLSNLWLMRQWGWRDWARASEVYGMPIRKAIVPEGAPDEDKRRFLDEVFSIGNETTVRVPQGTDEKFDVQLLEPTKDLHAAFMAFIDSLNASIAITVLGQNLSTEVQGGSYAAAQAHEAVRWDRLSADAETMAQTIRSQVLEEWSLRVFGTRALAPFPKWQTEPPEDLAQKSTTMAALAQALQPLQIFGADVPQVLERFGVPVKPQDDKQEETTGASIVLAPTDAATIITVNEARASLGLPPADADGDLTLTEFKAKHSATVADAAAAESGEAAPAPTEPAKQLRDRPSIDARASQTYVDQVSSSARKAIADDMAPYFRAVRAALRKSKTPEEAIEALLKVFADADTGKAAEALAKSQVLAQLAGRVSVGE